MQRSQINKINVERLSRWKDKLNNEHATPIVLVGIGHDQKSGQVVVCTTEDRTNQDVLLLLRESVRMLEQEIINSQ